MDNEQITEMLKLADRVYVLTCICSTLEFHEFGPQTKVIFGSILREATFDLNTMVRKSAQVKLLRRKRG